MKQGGMIRTSEARREPPNQTAYLCRLWEITSTSTPDDYGSGGVSIKTIGCEGMVKYLENAAASRYASIQSLVDEVFQVTLQALTKMLEHCRTT